MNNPKCIGPAADGFVPRLTPWLIVALSLMTGAAQAQPVEASAPPLTGGSVLAYGQLPESDSLAADVWPSLQAPMPSAGSRTLWHTLYDGGWVGVLILVLSLISVAFMVEHALTIRRTVVLPPRVLHEIEVLIAQGHIERAWQRSQAPENASLATEVIRAGLQRYRASELGFTEYRDAVEEAGERLVGRLYRKTDILGVIGAIAPMLGLTGTVLGMIRAFNTIAMSGGTARPDQLAGGISEALVTTLLGLTVAIPTMVAFSFFRNRIDALASESAAYIERILLPLGRRG
jgi:biopolymer transport protein ExbB